MKILAIDTSTKAGSVCLLNNDEIIGELYFNLEKTHSERILPIIDYLLKFSKTDINEIDLFVSGIGPGSFTGIRIGLSIAKGFSFALKKPLIGVSSLDALANDVYIEDEFISIIEGRNNEFFYAVFKRENEHLIKKSNYLSVKINELPKKKYAIILSNLLFLKNNKKNYNFPFENIIKGKLYAHNFGFIGFKKYKKTEVLSDVNPLYLKPSDAEINFKKSL